MTSNGRSILVVWTIGDLNNSEDFYEVFEDKDEAFAAYNRLYTVKNLLVASIAGVIDSTDYEPYEFGEYANESEEQLENFLESREEKIFLFLEPQGDDTLIRREATNLCRVRLGDPGYTREWVFGGISEPFYNRMMKRFC